METPVEIFGRMLSPAYTLFSDLKQISQGNRPTMYGYRKLEDPGIAAKLLAMGGRVGQDIAPGLLVDLVRIAKADGPTMEEPWNRSKELEAIRAAGVPIVRIRPDLDYFRALEQTGNGLKMAMEHSITAKSRLDRWYWDRIAKRAQTRLDELMRLGPPPSGADLPSQQLRDIEDMLIMREPAEVPVTDYSLEDYPARDYSVEDFAVSGAQVMP